MSGTPWRSSRSTGRSRPSGSSRSEEHTSELQSRIHLVCRLLLEKKKTIFVSPFHAQGVNVGRISRSCSPAWADEARHSIAALNRRPGDRTTLPDPPIDPAFLNSY